LILITSCAVALSTAWSAKPRIDAKEVEEINVVGYALMDHLGAKPIECPAGVVGSTEVSVLFCGTVPGAPRVDELTTAIDKYLITVRGARVVEASWKENGGSSVRGYSIHGVSVTVQVITKGRVVIMHYPMSCLPLDAAPELGSPGAEITAPELIERTTPDYPPVALRVDTQAKVLVHAVVREDGSVGPACVLYESYPRLGFGDAALTAVKKWRYNPARLNGEAVPVSFLVIVEFFVHHTPPPQPSG
jgi:TonB family protein